MVCPALSLGHAVRSVNRLGFPFETQDPFLFCVYHDDQYPAGDAKMQAPRRGNGADFDWSQVSVSARRCDSLAVVAAPGPDRLCTCQPYRMYHGDRVPGFPQHPHRGFETLTTTLEGRVDHTDSMGNAGRYGDGDLQWMTAGAVLLDSPPAAPLTPCLFSWLHVWLLGSLRELCRDACL